jgi:OOP family OmpA-OmpF porin
MLMLVLLSSSLAQAEWYAGAKVGTSNMDLDAGFDFPPNTETDDSADLTWNLFGGYNFTPKFGLEFGYGDLGDEYDLFNSFGRDEKITLDASILYVTLIGRIKVHDRVDLFSRLGVAYWDAGLDYVESGFSSSDSDADVDPVIGLGFEWHINKVIDFRFEWEQFQNVGDEVKTALPSTTGVRLELNGHDISVLGIGVTYRF